MKPRPGDTFTHKYFLAQDDSRWRWTPESDERPKALMRVTAVRRGTVYYTYADDPSNKGAFYCSLRHWEENYA